MRHTYKRKRALARRVADWNDMPAIGMSGTRTKLVRRHDGKGGQAFHKPGSINWRKGSGRDRSKRR